MNHEGRCVAIALSAPTPEGGHRPVRAAQRFVRAAGLQVATLRVRRRLRDEGYAHSRVLRYDLERWQDPAATGWGSRLAIVRALPLRSVVVASHEEPSATIVEAVVEEAAALDPSLRGHPPRLRSSGILLVVGESVVLRVAVGPARRQLVEQRKTLEDLPAPPHQPE